MVVIALCFVILLLIALAYPHTKGKKGGEVQKKNDMKVDEEQNPITKTENGD